MFMLKAILMMILPFYRTDFPVADIPQTLIYSIYDHGVVVRRGQITVGEGEYESIKRVLVSERKGWKFDMNTYAPSRVYSSPSMNINCLSRGLVVNYKDGSDWVQISKMGLHNPCESK